MVELPLLVADERSKELKTSRFVPLMLVLSMILYLTYSYKVPLTHRHNVPMLCDILCSLRITPSTEHSFSQSPALNVYQPNHDEILSEYLMAATGIASRTDAQESSLHND